MTTQLTIHMRDELGSNNVVTVDLDQMSDKAAWAAAGQATQDWCRRGEWGIDGASVRCWCWWETEAETTEDAESVVVVEIEPDEDALIAAAGGNTDCDHDWVATYDFERGLKENPGVWMTGGTAMTIKTHCAKCGLKRTERSTGSQRNPGEHDTVEFELPTDEELERMGLAAAE